MKRLMINGVLCVALWGGSLWWAHINEGYTSPWQIVTVLLPCMTAILLGTFPFALFMVCLTDPMARRG